MGVDYYTCDHCGDIYDDYRSLYDFCEECGTRICYDCQVKLGMRDIVAYWTPDEWFGNKSAKPLGDYWKIEKCVDNEGQEHTYYDLISCPYCKKEQVSDADVLVYLLKKYDLNLNDVVEEIKATN